MHRLADCLGAGRLRCRSGRCRCIGSVALRHGQVSGKGAWPRATGAPTFIDGLNTISDGVVATSIRDCFLQGVDLKRFRGKRPKLSFGPRFASLAGCTRTPPGHQIDLWSRSQGIDHVTNNTVTFA